MPELECKLLIVDDSPEDRTVVRLLLEEAPGRTWHFMEEEKGAAALKRLETFASILWFERSTMPWSE
jgi:CheY-like chemotaxis protein